jgi:hypothetical protein
MPITSLLLAFLLSLSMANVSRAADVDGERLVTPNQERRVVQVNRDLPKDLLDQSGDSRKVAELRGRLRESISAYRQAVQQFGTPTAESRAAAHQVLEAQTALHKRFHSGRSHPRRGDGGALTPKIFSYLSHAGLAPTAALYDFPSPV